jgi:hypothetical protein
MNPRDPSFLNRVIKERAERLGVGEADVRKGLSGKPQFLRAAERRAAGLFAGSAQEILRRDLSGLTRDEYPGPDCIMPYEIDDLREKGLPALAGERFGHAQECTFCSALLASLDPTEVNLQDFLRVARRAGVAAVTVARY